MPPSTIPLKTSGARTDTAVSVSQVAQAAGVSQGIVYSFLKGKYYGRDRNAGIGMSAATRDKIVSVARELKFQPSTPAGFSRIYPDRTDFAFLLSNTVRDGVANAYWSQVFAGVSDFAVKPGMRVSFNQFDSAYDYLGTGAQLPHFLSDESIVKFIVGGKVNYSLLLKLSRKQRLVGYVSRSVDVPGVWSVVPDYRRAGYLGVKGLLEAGHTNVAIIAENYFQHEAYNTTQISQGCADAFGEAGIPFEADQVIYLGPVGERFGEPNDLEQLVSCRPTSTSAFCFDDATAIRVALSLQGRGIAIPYEYSIVGCNNDISPALAPCPITTIELPIREMGRVCAAELNRASLDPEAEEQRTIVLPVSVVDRGSVSGPTSRNLK